jgi:hypothetical protein
MKKSTCCTLLFIVLNISVFSQNLAPKVGADKDKHDCIGSAGYTYSSIKNDCIRVFEQNIRLTEVSPKGSFTSMTSIIFSKDSLKVEVFLPNYNRGQILNKKVSNGKYYWQKGNLVLKRKKGFELFENSKLIYKQS